MSLLSSDVINSENIPNKKKDRVINTSRVIKSSEYEKEIDSLNSQFSILKTFLNKFDAQTRDQYLPFDQLWKSKDDCYRKMAQLKPEQKQAKTDLENAIDRLEESLENVTITKTLRRFISILSKAKHVTLLFCMYEQHRGRARQTTKPEASVSETRDSLDITLFWRNLKPFVTTHTNNLTNAEYRLLVQTMETLFVKGCGFELIDGDHYIFWGNLINKFNHQIKQSDRVMTVSVQGPQSTGKSTLVNLAFGTDFKSGTGKCTSGVDGYLMRVEDDFDTFKDRIYHSSGIHYQKPQIVESDSQSDLFRVLKSDTQGSPTQNDNLSYMTSDESENEITSIIVTGHTQIDSKYILFLDSQGVLSNEDRNTDKDPDFDRKMSTLLLCVSQILLINFSGDLQSDFFNLLEKTCYSLQKMDHKKLMTNHTRSRLKMVSKSRLEETQRCVQKSIFVSNRNQNLGSTSNQEKMTKDVKSIIFELGQNIRDIFGSKPLPRSLPFCEKESSIELLRNAKKKLYIEKNSSINLPTDLTRTWFDPIFISSLQRLKETVIHGLQAVSQSHDPELGSRWTFSKFPRYFSESWKQIYFAHDLFDMNDVRRQIVERESTDFVDQQLEVFVRENRLREDFMVSVVDQVSLSRHSYERFLELETRKSIEFLGEQRVYFSESEGNDQSIKTKYRLFQDIFGSIHTPKSIEYLKRLSVDKRFLDERKSLKMINKVYSEDYTLFTSFINMSYAKFEDFLKKWASQKNQNIYNVIRKNLVFKIDDILGIFRKKRHFLLVFEQVQKFNFVGYLKKRTINHFITNARSCIFNKIKETIKTSIEVEYPNDTQSVQKNLSSIVQKSKNEYIQNIKNLLFSLEETSPFYTLILHNIFEGLHKYFFVDQNQPVWFQEDFRKNSIELLSKVQNDMFTPDIVLIRRTDTLSESALFQNKLIGFDSSQIERRFRFKVIPQTEDELKDNLVKNFDSLYKGKSESEFLWNFQSVLEQLSQLKIVVSDEATISNVLKKNFGKSASKETKLRTCLNDLAWNVSEIQEPSILGHLKYNVNLHNIISKLVISTCRIFEKDKVFDNDMQLSWSEKFLSQFSLDPKKYNLFFYPSKCKSIEMIKSVYGTVLHTINFKQKLLDFIQELFGYFEEKHFDPISGFEILKMTPDMIESIREDILLVSLTRLKSEASDFGVKISEGLVKTIYKIVYQKTLSLYQDKFIDLFENTIKPEIESKLLEIERECREKIIEPNLNENPNHSYSDFFSNVEHRLDQKIQSHSKEDIERITAHIKKNIPSKLEIMKELDSCFFSKTDTSETCYERVISYIKDPQKHIFEKIETLVKSKSSEIKGYTLENQVDFYSKKIKESIDFLECVNYHLKKNRLYQIVKVFDIDKGSLEQRNEDFLNTIINKRKIVNSVKSGTSHKLNISIPHSNDLLIEILVTKPKVDDLQRFITSLIEHLQKYRDGFEQKPFLVREVDAKMIQKLQETVIGCEWQCPGCGRLCEKEKHSTQKPHLTSLGHFIKDIHQTNQARERDHSIVKQKLYGQSPFVGMRLQFCQGIESNKTNQTDDLDQTNWINECQSTDELNRDLRDFWTRFGDLHCQRHFFTNLEKQKPIYFSVFCEGASFGSVDLDEKVLRIKYTVKTKILQKLVDFDQRCRIEINALVNDQKTTTMTTYLCRKKETIEECPQEKKRKYLDSRNQQEINFKIIENRIRKKLTKSKFSHVFILAFQDIENVCLSEPDCEDRPFFTDEHSDFMVILFLRNSEEYQKSCKIQSFFGKKKIHPIIVDYKKLVRGMTKMDFLK